MRDVPKQLVAAMVHERGLLAGLIQAAAGGTEIAPAARALIDAVMNPSITSIDLDDAQYQAGVVGLVGYGVITQEDADAVSALHTASTPWTYAAAVPDGPGRWLLVFSKLGAQCSIMYHGSTPDEHGQAVAGSI